MMLVLDGDSKPILVIHICIVTIDINTAFLSAFAHLVGNGVTILVRNDLIEIMISVEELIKSIFE
jgi:hypothetical protein